MERVFVLTAAMVGGGERHSLLLANGFAAKGHPTCLVITHQRSRDALWYDADEKINVFFLLDHISETEGVSTDNARIPIGAGQEADGARIAAYRTKYAPHINELRRLFGPESCLVIGLVHSSVNLAVFAVRQNQRLLIAEAGNPSIYTETGMALIRQEYPKATHVVLQSPGAQEWYQQHAGITGTVIPNPLMPGLPTPWEGERTKEIVNFCRFAPAKNLPLLVRAFALLHKDYPDYRLVIYGYEPAGAHRYITYQVLRTALECGCADCVDLRPYCQNIHDEVRKCAMFVSSSDTEGLSNSMIEAMAIGLPTICTDCPIGGARYIIEDHENGLLTPVGDEQALYLAMREVIESPELSRKLSRNGFKIRERLDEQRIMQRWYELE